LKNQKDAFAMSGGRWYPVQFSVRLKGSCGPSRSSPLSRSLIGRPEVDALVAAAKAETEAKGRTPVRQ
jgi:hypothetical protein